MRIGRYRFSPGLVPTLVTVALLPLLTGLGVWQLHRAEEKRSIEHIVARRSEAPRLELDASRWSSIHQGADASSLAYRRVTMSGRFEGARQYLLDNRTRNGVAGFHVLTAFIPGGAAGGVLVNRGWIPVGERRDLSPALPVPSKELLISGAFDALRNPPPLLGPSGYEQRQWPKIVQRVELEPMAKQLGILLLPRMILLDPDAPAGFVREWKPYYGISVERHQAYAFQWFALAAALALIYIVVNLKRIDSD
ncbi:MAG TPA: SURF1 family protein [Gammaproteobacteria bacterium]|nr:SURF1 family protein [Gammaproteobacteria bacterium]